MNANENAAQGYGIGLMAEAGTGFPERLNSWKEIAAFLGRGLRTVQRWEHDLDLPVHRNGTGPRSPVYALTTELNFWITTWGAMRGEAAHGSPLKLPAGKPVENSRRLASKIHTLVRAVAENSVRQRRQAEVLEKRILEIRSRMKARVSRKTAPPLALVIFSRLLDVLVGTARFEHNQHILRAVFPRNNAEVNIGGGIKLSSQELPARHDRLLPHQHAAVPANQKPFQRFGKRKLVDG